MKERDLDNIDLDDPEEYQPRRGPYPLLAGLGRKSPDLLVETPHLLR
jgi:hypothetical protein